MTAAPLIPTLIDKTDNVEIIRDKIAEILLVESDRQRVLAQQDGKDPALWKLRVFTERGQAYDEWLEPPADGHELDTAPILNVSWDKSEDDAKASNSVTRQKVDGTFQIDCYGYGVATPTTDGHDPGDSRAALEAQRAARLVRNILMHSRYKLLGLPGTVWRRWRESAQSYQPPDERNTAGHVQAVRVTMRVEFNEESVPVPSVPLAAVHVTIKRSPDGEVTLVDATIPTPPQGS